MHIVSSVERFMHMPKKTQEGRIEKVVWMDACFDEARPEYIKEHPASSFLIRTETYGKVMSIDDKAIVIGVSMTDKDTTDFYCVPRCWIVSPTKYARCAHTGTAIPITKGDV